MDRRSFLTGTLALMVAPVARARAATEARRSGYAVEVGMIWGTIGLHLGGTWDESVDRTAGRYEIKATGEGSRISNRLESRGLLRGGRWAPLDARAWFDVVGRTSQSAVSYDYGRRAIAYHFQGETFLLRRQRVADDTVAIPEGRHVDDVFSAVLNYADGRWPPGPDGRLHTYVIRRQRPEGEGPDDAREVYRAELVPLALEVVPDPETGRQAATFDLSRFSSWARDGKPGRIVFGSDRRPESITASLILGTSLAVRIKSAA
jgi:hypothetical protein